MNMKMGSAKVFIFLWTYQHPHTVALEKEFIENYQGIQKLPRDVLRWYVLEVAHCK